MNLAVILGLAGLTAALSVGLGKYVSLTLLDREQNLLAKAGLAMDEALVRIRPVLADPDGDGFIEPPLGEDWAAAPTGGYGMPAGITPAVDPWGTPLGYCVWDNGNYAGGRRLPGGFSLASVAYAVISAGPDRVFQTTCADAGGAGMGVGDDGVRRVTQSQLAAGFGGKYWGDPVADIGDLMNLRTCSDGEQRIVLDAAFASPTYICRGGFWVKQAGLTSQPVGPNAVHGAAMNGGMSMKVALSRTMMAVVDGTGKVLYAGALTGDGWHTANALPETHALTLRDTGMMGKQVWVGDHTGWGLYGSSTTRCPYILGFDNTLRSPTQFAPCIASSYSPLASNVRRVAGEGLHPGILYNTGATANAGTPPQGSVVDVRRSLSPLAHGNVANPWGHLTNQNELHTGTYIVWGQNHMPSPLGSVRAFTSVSTTHYAIRTDGTLSVAGYNYYGELGLGLGAKTTGTNRVSWQDARIPGVPASYTIRGVTAALGCAIALTTTGDMYAAGELCSMTYIADSPTWTLTTTPAGQGLTASPVVNVWLPYTHSTWWIHGPNAVVVQTADGALYGKGLNDYGQLGLGHMSPVPTWQRIL